MIQKNKDKDAAYAARYLCARRKLLMQPHRLSFKLKYIVKMKLYLMGFTQELFYLEM